MIRTIICKAQEYEALEDKRVAWDLLKCDIQCKSTECRIRYAKEKRELENITLICCDGLYTQLCDTGLSEVEEQEYAEAKKILEEYKERGAFIRSRFEYIEKNEKSNKYFFNNEKESFDMKTVEQLKIDNVYITDPTEILRELRKYYSNLYHQKPRVSWKTF